MQVNSTQNLNTFPAAFATWQQFASPRLLFLLVVVTGLLRITQGSFGRGDGLALLAGILIWPLLEWGLHRYLLHRRPIRCFGYRIDPDFMRRHRAHHAEPFRPELIVFPAYVPLIIAPLLLAGVWFLAPDRALALSALFGFACAALNYEWTHFLVHTSIQPRSRYYQGLFRNHRLHHFRNENYWFSFTLTTLDRLLGTGPRPDDVPRSTTCRNLEVTEAAR